MVKIFYIIKFCTLFVLIHTEYIFTQIQHISGLSLWLKADSGVLINQNKVYEWRDLSGNNLHLIQTNPDNQPIYIETVDSLNFMPALFFNQSFMKLEQPITIGTIYVLCNYNFDNFQDFSGLITQINVVDANTDYLFVSNSSGTYFYSSPLLQQSVYINQTQTNNFAPLKRPKIIKGILSNPVTWNNLMIGYDRSLWTRFWSGYIFEIIIFDRQLTGLEQQIVENYLMNKYAPPLAFNHNILYCLTFPFLLTTNGYYQQYLWSTGDTTSEIFIQQPGNYSVSVTDIFGRTITDSILLCNLCPSLSNTYFLCNFEDSIVINPQLSANLTYLWQDSSTLPYYVTNTPGKYWVHIIDSSGCYYFSDTINVIYDPILTNNILNDTIYICRNDSLTINNNNISSYLWSNGDTLNYILPQNTQWYFLTITSANNCIFRDSIYTIIKGDKPQPKINKNRLCVNSNTIYSGISTGNIQQWRWIFQDTIIKYGQIMYINYDQPGIYNTYLQVIDSNTCSATSFSKDTIYSYPMASLVYHGNCNNNAFFSSNSVSEDSIVTFIWNIDNNVYTGKNICIESNLNCNVFHWIETKHGCSDTVLYYINNNLVPLKKAEINFPNEGIIMSNNYITFNWNNESQLSVLEISTTHDFSNFIHRSPYLSKNYYNYLLPYNNTYYWRIWSYNLCGDSVVSDNYSFSIINTNSFDSISFWFSSDTGVVNDQNNKISEWHDHSNNNLILSQTDENLKPIYVANVDSLNNKPAIRFQNSKLELDNNINIGTYYIIANYHDTFFTDYSGLFTKKIIYDYYYDFLLVSNNNGTYFFNSFINQDIKINNINTLNFAPLTRFKIIKGEPEGVLSWENLSIGKDRNYIGRFWKGDITEIIAFKKLLSLNESELIERYLMDKYAPPVLLPADTVLTTFCPFTIKPNGYFTSYLWSTGQTSDSIVVTQSGKYKVTATDIFGRTSSDSIIVTFPSTHIPDTIYVCAGDSALVTSALGNLVDYQWSNGYKKNFSFVKNKGWHYVTITDMYGYTAIDSFFVYVDSLPISNLFNSDSIYLCAGNKLFIDYPSTFQIVSCIWNNEINSNYMVVSNSGFYNVEVIDENNCRKKDSIYINIKGKTPVVNFNYTHTCLGDTTYLTDLSYSQDTSAITYWLWIVNNKDTLNTQNAYYLFTDYGLQNVKLIVETTSGCKQDTSLNLIVHPLPQPSFNAYGFCERHKTFFTNTSSIPFDTIVLNIWNFGDNLEEDTSYNAEYTYNIADVYNVTLTCISDKNCKNQITKVVHIKERPYAGFYTSATCVNSPIYFVDTSKSNYYYPIISWQWNFGDGNSSNLQYPVHTYSSVDDYTVYLVIKSLNGCTDTVKKVISVSSKPVVGIKNDTACYKNYFNVYDTSFVENALITKRYWFKNGQIIQNNKDTITLFADILDTLQLSLLVETNTGCRDSLTKNIIIRPLPYVSFIPSTQYGALPLIVNFLNNSSQGYSLWFFGDGSATTQYSPSHVYNDTGLFIVKLIQTNNFGCKDSMQKYIRVVPVIYDLTIKNVECKEISNLLQLNANILNTGTLPISDIILKLNINGMYSFYELVEDTIYPSQVLNYQFKTLINKPEKELRFICITGYITQNEIDYTNNFACKSYLSNNELLLIYPLPFQEHLNILFNSQQGQKSEVNIYDIKGKLIFNEQTTISTGMNLINLNIRNIKPGIYILKITTENSIFVKKITKI